MRIPQPESVPLTLVLILRVLGVRNVPGRADEGGGLRTFFHVLRLCGGKWAGVHSDDQQSDENRAYQHYHPYI